MSNPVGKSLVSHDVSKHPKDISLGNVNIGGFVWGKKVGVRVMSSGGSLQGEYGGGFGDQCLMRIEK